MPRLVVRIAPGIGEALHDARLEEARDLPGGGHRLARVLQRLLPQHERFMRHLAHQLRVSARLKGHRQGVRIHGHRVRLHVHVDQCSKVRLHSFLARRRPRQALVLSAHLVHLQSRSSAGPGKVGRCRRVCARRCNVHIPSLQYSYVRSTRSRGVVRLKCGHNLPFQALKVNFTSLPRFPAFLRFF